MISATSHMAHTLSPTAAVEMDHRSFVANLPRADKDRLAARSDRPGLVHLAGHLGAIALVSGPILAEAPGWPVLLLPQAVLVIFLFSALHEAVHDTAFRTAWLNRAVAGLAGFALLLPPTWFRYFHFAHHRHTHDPARDPELQRPEPRTVGQYVWHLCGIPAWRGQARALLVNAAGAGAEAFVPARGRAKVVREARAHLAGYGLLAAGSVALGTDALVWTWIVPLLIGQPVLRAYLLAEHARCPFVADMFANTRTTFTNRLVRFLAWNMPFHAEHHADPNVPFHKLPAFHAMARAHLKVTENGYGRFHARFVEGLG